MPQHCARATRSAAHVQVVRPSQTTQSRWDGAAELVASEVAESASGTPQHCAMPTFSAVHAQVQPVRVYVNLVRLPKLDGMVPLSWLLLSELRAQAERLSTVQWRHSAMRTHRVVNPVRLPRLDGMVPLSWLLRRSLTVQAGRLSTIAHEQRHMRHTHSCCKTPLLQLAP